MASDSRSQDLNVIGRPACRHLRSKGMYVTGKLDPANEDYEGMGDGHCWCNLTQHELGPDDQLVVRDDCIVHRKCFEPQI
jgi:hypothetical protein